MSAVYLVEPKAAQMVVLKAVQRADEMVAPMVAYLVRCSVEKTVALLVAR